VLDGRLGAVEGRIQVDSTIAELVGVAPLTKGTALSPAEIAGGYSFGAYGLPAKSAQNDLKLVFVAHGEGDVSVSVVIDAAADKMGRRISIGGTNLTTSVHVGHGHRKFGSGGGGGGYYGGPARGAGVVRTLFGRDTITQDDVDIARAAWYATRGNASNCQTSGLPVGDANGDGCIDIVDLQALNAFLGGAVTSAWTADGTYAAPKSAPLPATAVSPARSATQSATQAALTAGKTFVVNSTADTGDATNGDGICADSQGQCTLRAALDESNWQAGHNTVSFNLPGTAPVLIQLSAASMQLLGATSSSVTVDGYSQPGSRVNTATYGTNAIPGVVLRGADAANTRFILYSARPDNVIRGIALANSYRGIFLDTANASNNLIVGDWIGYNGDGSLAALGHAGVYINGGAHGNIVGTPALADRNVIGNVDKGIYAYGPGSDNNIIQNNLVCISPTGATAVCSTGIDFDFGPKNTMVGGTDAAAKNVIGATALNGIELSHGWDPSTNHVSTPQYQINGNQVIGNWVGFRQDGSYDPSYRSAQSNPTVDNGQALHAYDGANNNVFQGNYVAAAFDGVTIAISNSTGNIVRGNIIGRSPLGQAAPLGRYGIYFASNTHGQVVEGNIIDNAAAGARLDELTRSRLPVALLTPDPNDPTKGANDMLPAPTITTATTSSVGGTASAGSTVEVFMASRNAGAFGLPTAYLGSATVDGSGNWTAPVTAQSGQRVTATQIVPDGDTSAVAANVIVGSPPTPVADFTSKQRANTLVVDFTDTSTGEPTGWSWDFGDGSVSTDQNPIHTYSSAGNYSVKLTASNAAGGNTMSHVVTVQPVSTGVTLVSDTFSRDQNSGWGSADTGGLYTIELVSTNFAVNAGSGAMTVPTAGSTRAADLTSVSGSDVDARNRVTLDKIPTGGAYYVYSELRRNGNNAYRGKVIFKADGSVAVQASRVVNDAETDLGAPMIVSGLTTTPGAYLWLDVAVTGSNPSTITVKVWADGSPEPGNPQFIATDGNANLQAAGYVALRSYASRSVTNTPITGRFDDYTVTSASPPPPGPVAVDGFSRTFSGGWGSADGGGPYTIIGNASNMSVDGSAGKMVLPSAGATRGAWLADSYASDVDVTYRVAVDKVAAGGSTWIYSIARRSGTSEYRPRVQLKKDGTVTVGVSVLNAGKETSLGDVAVAGLTQAPGQYIWVHAQISGTNPTTIKIRAWLAGQHEPSAWQLTVTDATASVQGPGAVGLLTYLASGATSGPTTLSFDDYSVTKLNP